jgi:Ca-activated chloride channel family protein
MKPSPYQITTKDGKPVKLAMQELFLSGRILPVGAELTVRHVFKSAERGPVEAIYAFGLPRDAQLRSFRIFGKGFSVVSELKPTEEAESEYEEAVASGNLAALARAYRDGVVNLSVGNLRPDEEVVVELQIVAGVDLRDDGLRFRFPFALAPGYHPRARNVESGAGEGEIELPEEEFGDVILPRWMREAKDLHRVAFDLRVCLPVPVKKIGSPSHSIEFSHEAEGEERVVLATEGDVPDRDLVLDVNTAEEISGVVGGVPEEGKPGGLAVVVPSGRFGEAPKDGRRVVFVVDRSGSMDGAPMRQAKKAVEACLGALSPEDEFGIVAFDDRVEFFSKRLLPADAENREKAAAWLDSIDARGGTELFRGIRAGLSVLGEASGDILLLTDGQVFGSE